MKLSLRGLYESQRELLCKNNWNQVDASTYLDLPSTKNALEILAVEKPNILPVDLRIKRPLGRYASVGFLQAVGMSNPSCEELVHAICALKPLYKVHRLHEIKIRLNDRDFVLRLFTWMQGQQLRNYRDALLKLRDGPTSFGRSAFSDSELPSFKSHLAPDAWLDTQNLCIWSFDKNFMFHLPEHFGNYEDKKAAYAETNN
jgi:hypothetical protein